MSRLSDIDRLKDCMRRPRTSFAYFGVDPAWTPERERHTKSPVPGSNQGLPKIARSCKICGGQKAEGSGDDPLFDADTQISVCASCMRTPKRYAKQHKGAIYAPNAKRPGRLVAKVAGKTDEDLVERINREAAC